MIIIIPILILLSVTFFTSIYYNRRSLDLLPLTIFAITFILYVFYIINLLRVGFYLIIISAIMLWGLGIYKIVKEKNIKLLKNFFSPGLFILILAILIIYFVTIDNNVLLWDELILWGAYPKILFYEEKLQLGNSALLWEAMQHYPPGMPLFQYFFMKCCNSFNPAFLYFCYSIVGLSLFTPFLNKVKSKKIYIGILVLMLLIMFPLAFGNSPDISDYLGYYDTLFIDCLLGMMFGYIMYLSIHNVFKTKIGLINFTMTLTFLLLLKNTALLFGIIGLISTITCEIFIYKNYKGKKLLMYCLIPFSALIFTTGSFNLLLKFYNVEVYHVSSMNISSILTFIFRPNKSQLNIVNDFINYFINGNLIESNNTNITPYCTALSFGILYTIILIIFSKKEKNNKIGSIYLGIGSILFIIGLIFLYVLDLNSIQSFVRYINTLNYAILLYIILSFTDLYKTMNLKISLIFISLFLLILPIYKIIPMRSEMINQRKTSDSMVEYIKDGLDNGTNKVLCIIDDDQDNYNVIYNHHLYFETIGTNNNVPIFAMYTINLFTDKDEFLDNYLKKEYTHIYILSINKELPKWFKTIVNNKIERGKLYESYFKNNQLKFKEIEVW